MAIETTNPGYIAAASYAADPDNVEVPDPFHTEFDIGILSYLLSTVGSGGGLNKSGEGFSETQDGSNAGGRITGSDGNISSQSGGLVVADLNSDAGATVANGIGGITVVKAEGVGTILGGAGSAVFGNYENTTVFSTSIGGEFNMVGTGAPTLPASVTVLGHESSRMFGTIDESCTIQLLNTGGSQRANRYNMITEGPSTIQWGVNGSTELLDLNARIDSQVSTVLMTGDIEALRLNLLVRSASDGMTIGNAVGILGNIVSKSTGNDTVSGEGSFVSGINEGIGSFGLEDATGCLLTGVANAEDCQIINSTNSQQFGRASLENTDNRFQVGAGVLAIDHDSALEQIGVFGAIPVTQRTDPASPAADVNALKTCCDALRQILLDLGFSA